MKTLKKLPCSLCTYIVSVVLSGSRRTEACPTGSKGDRYVHEYG